jgi:hypothetical protein
LLKLLSYKILWLNFYHSKNLKFFSDKEIWGIRNYPFWLAQPIQLFVFFGGFTSLRSTEKSIVAKLND